MRTELNYKHLRYFWAVAREGSVTRAAERLGMSVQTVSGQISRLEQAFGQALFNQQGRNLVLTEAGRAALSYAERIFLLGEELSDILRDDALDKTIRLTAGISDVVPKTVSYHLLEPALQMEERVRLVCREAGFDELLTELTLHRLDVVLADRPALSTQSQFESHLLSRCPVNIYGTKDLCRQYRDGFPHSLAGAPLLLPTRDNILRGQVENWLETLNLRVQVVGEFEDGALLKTFGGQGFGLFPAPSFASADITGHFAVDIVGPVDGVFEHYWAIANRKKLQHRAVEAICNTALYAS
ncbi:LysR family transcriptional regulator [Craterilacuibacter sp. RT1T]|uniref:LysR family transcriptional regulator n=1 Tax=Craterilacuibacter sp. RT1T TaxID=2942211 RepID=UPI0020BF893A|nr:LysR family transcriptional regulator [Craterilacuibacter sp. RT1T]MCL6262718.1 LysR family transcriptional regulator [Craterilacuibacter sp. RT1T]